MAKERGTKVLLYVGDGASPEVFTKVAGQRTTTLTLNATSIDASDKDNADWGTTLSGMRSGTIAVSGVANWPDTDGLNRLREVYQQPDVDETTDRRISARAILNRDGDYWEGTWTITTLEIAGGHDGATEYSVTLESDGELTYVEGTS